MKRLGNTGHFANTSLDHQPSAPVKVPKCSDCKNENNGFCNEHQVLLSLIEDVEELAIVCFEPK